MEGQLRGLVVTGALLFLLACVNCQDCQGFKQGAEEHVQVQYRQKLRKTQLTEVVTEGEVLWQPHKMLSNPSCYDLTKSSLLFRPVNSDKWEVASDRQRSAGQYAKWIIELKPCLEYQFAIKVSPFEETAEEEALFELPKTLGPASAEAIMESGYRPNAPTHFKADVNANSAKLSWTPSDCATNYEVGFFESGDNTNYRSATASNGQFSVNLGDLKPCTRYEATVTAFQEDEIGEDLVSAFATKPRLDAASNLNPILTSTLDSVTISWEAWKSVSCIDQYEVTVCTKNTEQCHSPVTVTKPLGLPTVSYTFENLDPCTLYTIEVQPLYPDTNIESKTFEFRTKSPPADIISIERVTGLAISTGSMQVSWSGVKCAEKYRVYQKATDASEWTDVAETTETDITVDNITPCTKYSFAISALLADGSETTQSVGPEMISDLNENDPFEAPNLFVMNADRHADVSWGHADCIESYVVKVCQEAYTDCREENVNPNEHLGEDNDRTIRFKIEHLDPCTQYSLEIIPIITGKIFTARQNMFSTTNGIPQAPENFKVTLQENKADLSWSSVQCSTGYKVYYKTSDPSSKEAADTTQKLQEEFKNPTPCETYFYAVSTLVAEQESAHTDWFSMRVPPKYTELPALKILNNENDNITLRLEPTSVNAKCLVEEYELSYSSDYGHSFKTIRIKANENPSGDILLSFPGATGEGTVIKGRLRYSGDSEKWSSLTSTKQSTANQGPLTGTNVAVDGALIPIVVGVIVALVVAIIVVIFIVKRMKARNRDDAGKTNSTNGKLSGNRDETQKLNPSNANQLDV